MANGWTMEDITLLVEGLDMIHNGGKVTEHTHMCASCNKGLSDKDCPYAYCYECQETKTCQHGVLYKEDCSGCNALSDFQYDAMRERR